VKLFRPELRQPAGDDEWMWLLEGRFERPTTEVGRYGFEKVRGKIKGC